MVSSTSDAKLGIRWATVVHRLLVVGLLAAVDRVLELGRDAT